jgi:hypothetical protein
MSKRSVSAAKAYWRRRLVQENNLTHGKQQVLVARQALCIGNLRYNVGSILPDDKIDEKHLRALLDSRRAMYERRTKRHYPSPTPLPAPEAPKPRPAVLLVDDPDVISSWLATEAAMERVAGSPQYANDLLMADQSARDLYRRATFDACKRVAKIVGKPSVSPDFAWSFIKGRRAAA